MLACWVMVIYYSFSKKLMGIGCQPLAFGVQSAAVGNEFPYTPSELVTCSDSQIANNKQWLIGCLCGASANRSMDSSRDLAVAS